MDTSTKNNEIQGAGWLINDYDINDTFIPEDFSEEQIMVKDMCRDFLENEVFPVIDRIDKLEKGLMPALVEKAGELGLLGVSIPESYKGLGKDFITSTLVNEGLGGGYSFS